MEDVTQYQTETLKMLAETLEEGARRNQDFRPEYQDLHLACILELSRRNQWAFIHGFSYEEVH